MNVSQKHTHRFRLSCVTPPTCSDCSHPSQLLHLSNGVNMACHSARACVCVCECVFVLFIHVPSEANVLKKRETWGQNCQSGASTQGYKGLGVLGWREGWGSSRNWQEASEPRPVTLIYYGSGRLANNMNDDEITAGMSNDPYVPGT